jgi:hypothetical protein
MCKSGDSIDNHLGGSSYIAWPIGFLRNENVVERKNLTDEIKLTPADSSEGTKWYDFVFYIPVDTVPVMLEFKLNAADEIGRLVSGDKIPASL